MRTYVLFSVMSTLLFCSAVYAELVDNGDGTVTDTETGLMWQQGEGGEMSWEAALAYCENLVFPTGGYSDWRLPNRNELQSLVDCSEYDPAIDIVLFPGAISYRYWSSTTNAEESDDAWYVEFDTGYVRWASKSRDLYVRAVRGGQ